MEVSEIVCVPGSSKIQKHQGFSIFCYKKELVFSAKPSLDFSSVVRSNGQRWGRNMKYCKKYIYIGTYV